MWNLISNMTSHWCVFNCTMLFYVMLCSMYPMYVPYMVHNVTNISYSMSPIWCSMYPMYLILCPLYGTQCTHCNVPILCPLFWDQIGLLSLPGHNVTCQVTPHISIGLLNCGYKCTNS